MDRVTSQKQQIGVRLSASHIVMAAECIKIVSGSVCWVQVAEDLSHRVCAISSSGVFHRTVIAEQPAATPHPSKLHPLSQLARAPYHGFRPFLRSRAAASNLLLPAQCSLRYFQSCPFLHIVFSTEGCLMP